MSTFEERIVFTCSCYRYAPVLARLMAAAQSGRGASESAITL